MNELSKLSPTQLEKTPVEQESHTFSATLILTFRSMKCLLRCTRQRRS